MLSFLVEDWLGKCFILFIRSLVFFCFLFRCRAWFAVAVILWFIFNFRYQTKGLRSLLCIYVCSIELRTKKNRCRGLFKWEFLQSRTSISVNDLTARLQSAICTVLCSQYHQITLQKINGLNMHAIVISRFEFPEYATREEERKYSRQLVFILFPLFFFSLLDAITFFPLKPYNLRLNIVFLCVFVQLMQTTHGHLYFIVFMFECDFNSIPWRNTENQKYETLHKPFSAGRCIRTQSAP